MIALSAASAATPLIGRHLQTISGMTALGVGGNTYLPSIVSAMAKARFDLSARQDRRQLLAQTPGVLTEALQGIVGPEELAHPWPSHRQRMDIRTTRVTGPRADGPLGQEGLGVSVP